MSSSSSSCLPPSSTVSLRSAEISISTFAGAVAVSSRRIVKRSKREGDFFAGFSATGAAFGSGARKAWGTVTPMSLSHHRSKLHNQAARMHPDTSTDHVTVSTALGRLRGRRSGDGAIFLGIPFAEPPVGPLRWRPPQPVPAWEGTRDALAFGPDFPQPPDPHFRRHVVPHSGVSAANIVRSDRLKKG